MTLDSSAAAAAKPVEGDTGGEPADPGIVAQWGMRRSVVKVAVNGVERDGEIDPGRLVSLSGRTGDKPRSRVIHEESGERLLLEDATVGTDPVVNIVHEVGDGITRLVANVADLPLGRPVDYTVGATGVAVTRVIIDTRLGGW